MQQNKNSDLIERYEAMCSNGKSSYFDSEEFEEIIDFYDLNENKQAVKTAIEEGLKQHPENQYLLFKKAAYLISEGEYERALELINNLPVSATDESVMLLKADIFIRTGNTESALSIFDIILEQTENEFDFLDVSDILQSVKMFNEALDYLQRGKERFPGSTEIKGEIADIYRVLEDYDSTIRIYNEILDDDPYSSEDWTDLGELYTLKGDYESALDAFDFSLAIDESDERTLYLKSNTLILNGNCEKAIETLLEYSELIKTDETAYVLISECYSVMNEYENALHYARKSLEIRPDSVMALRKMIYVLLDKDNFSESLIYLDKALDFTPEESDLHFLKADVLISLDRFLEAEYEYFKALSLAQDTDEQIDIIYSIALLKQQQEKHEEALVYFEKTEAFRPDYPDLFLKMAVSYAESERFDEAVAYLNKTLEEPTTGLSPREIETRNLIITELKEILKCDDL